MGALYLLNPTKNILNSRRMDFLDTKTLKYPNFKYAIPDYLQLSESALPTVLQIALNFKVCYNFKVDAGFSVSLLSNFRRNCYSEDMI